MFIEKPETSQHQDVRKISNIKQIALIQGHTNQFLHKELYKLQISKLLLIYNLKFRFAFEPSIEKNSFHPMTMTCNLDFQVSNLSNQHQGKPVCQLSRLKIISYKSFCLDTQTNTSDRLSAQPEPLKLLVIITKNHRMNQKQLLLAAIVCNCQQTHTCTQACMEQASTLLSPEEICLRC